MRQRLQDVRILRQPEFRRTAAVLLELGPALLGDAPVGDGGRAYRDVDRKGRLAGRQHVARALDMDHGYPGRIAERGRAADQDGLRPEPRERYRDGMALFAGRTVGDVAHRIDRLEGRPAGHQRAPSGERLLGMRFARSRKDRLRLAAEIRLDRRSDLFRLRHAAFAELAAGHVSDAGTHAQHAACL